MTEEALMRRANALARRGEGWVSPNPMVGAVLVKDGRIIGEGWHARCGDLHAERAALKSCTESPRGAALFVTLEPCCHHGRQPPCTDAILQAGIRRVVIGSRDPNPKVHGKGAALLRAAGVDVQEDFLRAECDQLNPVFFHYITTRLPYVTMKYAMTADGKIATRTGASQWVTGEKARAHVQRLRHRHRGILVGIGTVLQDDPLLTCRMAGGRNPVRIICDSRLDLPPDSRLCQTVQEAPVIVAAAGASPEKRAALEAKGVTVLDLPGPDGKVDLSALCRELGKREIDSVLLEGGGTLNDAMLRAGLVQHVCAYLAPKLFGGAQAMTPVAGRGVDTPDDCIRLRRTGLLELGEDLLLEFDVEKEGGPCSPVS